MAKPTLVVMAAGIGSRYGGMKQIDPVGPNGELIIDYSIYDALKAGFGKVVFIIKEDMEELFREKIGARIEKRVETVYVRQRIEDLPAGFTVPPDRKKPWGTAHAVMSCRQAVSTPFAVINADDFYGASSFRLLNDFLKNAGDRDGIYQYCMVGFVLENTLTEHGHVARGVCTVDSSGNLVEIHERTRIEKFGELSKYTEDGENWVVIPKGSMVSMNTWGFTPGLFGELEAQFPQFLERSKDNLLKAEYFLPEVVGSLLAKKQASVKVLASPERWYGVTYQEDKPQVKQAIIDLVGRGIYPEKLWEDFQ
jgi:NDP-sugar pyrophosphorylase family protein